jgi:hypothetical protein
MRVAENSFSFNDTNLQMIHWKLARKLLLCVVFFTRIEVDTTTGPDMVQQRRHTCRVLLIFQMDFSRIKSSKEATL